MAGLAEESASSLVPLMYSRAYLRNPCGAGVPWWQRSKARVQINDLWGHDLLLRRSLPVCLITSSDTLSTSFLVKRRCSGKDSSLAMAS